MTPRSASAGQRGIRARRGQWLDRGERGSGPIATWIGFGVFLGMLLFAVQALLNLYATTVVTSVTYDAARQVAGSNGGPSAMSGAESWARRLLGRFGDQVSFDWSGTTADDVALRVRAKVPSVMLRWSGGAMPFGHIDRTVRLRVEKFR